VVAWVVVVDDHAAIVHGADDHHYLIHRDNIDHDHPGHHHHHGDDNSTLYHQHAADDDHGHNLDEHNDEHDFHHNVVHFGPAGHNHPATPDWSPILAQSTNDIYHEHDWQPKHDGRVAFDQCATCGCHRDDYGRSSVTSASY